jgi:transglutaminase-like putative cysteine protease
MTEGIDYYDRRRSERDDEVRDGAQFADYLAPGAIVDSAHPSIIAWTRDVVGDVTDEKARALRLYYAVRDRIRYDPYNTPMLRPAYLASTCLAKGQGYCVNKAGLLAAVLRASGIAARLGYADVRNHMTTKRLTERMGTDTFYYHGYVDVWLGGRWIKATPAFNRELTERFGLKPLEWDGETDSIYHPFDLGGRRHMQYLAYRGTFADIPFDEIRAAFRAYYPHMHRNDEAVAEGGDFAAEGAMEAAAARRV